MCTTCGCSDDAAVRMAEPGAPAGHHHSHGRTVPVEQKILARNDELADRNRAWLADRAVVAVNLMSSPGSGKTTLLERTVSEMGDEVPVSVVEGDQETLFDAERIRATGCRVIQVNTGAGCHLDAEMFSSALTALDPPERSVVFIENVGNLVCPALFDLGEHSRVVVTSVTEGADKPLKYPYMFRTADIVLLNKVDLLPYVAFDTHGFEHSVRQTNPRTPILHISATNGDGVTDWLGWLRERTRDPASTSA